MRRRGQALEARLAGARVVAADHVEVTVDLTAARDAFVEGGAAELVRTRTLAHVQRDWTGVGYQVARRTETVLGRTVIGPSGALVAGRTRRLATSLFLPAGQGSVAGQLVRQDYAVRVLLHAAGDGSVAAAGDLHVPVDHAPAPAGTPALTIRDADTAVLAVTALSGRRLSGGTPVAGELLVTSWVPVVAGRLRVELVIREHVPPAPAEAMQEDNDASTVVSCVRVADGLALSPGEPVRVPFAVPAPAHLAAPTLVAPEFSVRWLLRAVLDAGDGARPTSTVELHAATTG